MTNYHKIKWDYGEVVSYFTAGVRPGSIDECCVTLCGPDIHHTIVARSPRREATMAMVIFVQIVEDSLEIIHYPILHPTDLRDEWVPYFSHLRPKSSLQVSKKLVRGRTNGAATLEFTKIKWGAPAPNIDLKADTFPLGDEHVPDNPFQQVNCL